MYVTFSIFGPCYTAILQYNKGQLCRQALFLVRLQLYLERFKPYRKPRNLTASTSQPYLLFRYMNSKNCPTNVCAVRLRGYRRSGCGDTKNGKTVRLRGYQRPKNGRPATLPTRKNGRPATLPEPQKVVARNLTASTSQPYRRPFGRKMAR